MEKSIPSIQVLVWRSHAGIPNEVKLILFGGFVADDMCGVYIVYSVSTAAISSTAATLWKTFLREHTRGDLRVRLKRVKWFQAPVWRTVGAVDPLFRDGGLPSFMWRERCIID